MSIAPFIKDIGRGKEGARDLDRERARTLMEAVLDGRVSDLELGGFAIAMRIKGETPEELAGFLEAVNARMPALDHDSPVVVLPSYNGARKLPNLVPLLALALAREGVPVLVHGLPEDPGRVTSAEVFTALGEPLLDDPAQAPARWRAGRPAFVPLPVLHPSLARLLAVRRVLGLRNSGHTLAKLLRVLPAGRSLRVVNHTHPEYATSLSAFLALDGADALLMRGTEGEPVADARRAGRLDVFLAGRAMPSLSLAAQEGPLTRLPVLPDTIDAAATAAFTRAVLDGAAPMPEPIRRQLDLLETVRAVMMGRT
jgi:anthranilate phosphoribosyltransferase